MVRKPDATMEPAPQDNQLMSKHRVLSFKPQLRLEWRGQHGQNETEQPDHSASLGDSITSSTRIRFSVHTGAGWRQIQRIMPDAHQSYSRDRSSIAKRHCARRLADSLSGRMHPSKYGPPVMMVRE